MASSEHSLSLKVLLLCYMLLVTKRQKNSEQKRNIKYESEALKSVHHLKQKNMMFEKYLALFPSLKRFKNDSRYHRLANFPSVL